MILRGAEVTSDINKLFIQSSSTIDSLYVLNSTSFWMFTSESCNWVNSTNPVSNDFGVITRMQRSMLNLKTSTVCGLFAHNILNNPTKRSQTLEDAQLLHSSKLSFSKIFLQYGDSFMSSVTCSAILLKPHIF